jgi:hypothetical protein
MQLVVFSENQQGKIQHQSLLVYSAIEANVNDEQG